MYEPDKFHNLQLKHALSIELRTGLKLSKGSVLGIVNRKFGKTFRNKSDAYSFMCNIVDNDKGGIPNV